MAFTKANSKSELIDETRHILRKSLGVKASDELVTRIVNRRAEKIREGIEDKCPRILISGMGSFKIKKGKKQADGSPRKGREYYVKKANKQGLTGIAPRFITEFKIVSDDEEAIYT